MIPALIPSCERLRAEGRRDLGLADQLEVDRQGADLQRRRQFLGLADVAVKPPEIWAPLRPSIPSGFSAKLMIGRVLTSLSRTTAKWPESAAACSALTGPIACAWPRWAIWRVTSWKASRPLSVKPKVTFGSLFCPYSCFGSVMSVPESAGLSLQREPAGLGGLVDLAGFVRRVFGDEDRAGRDFDDDAVLRQLFRRSG